MTERLRLAEFVVQMARELGPRRFARLLTGDQGVRAGIAAHCEVADTLAARLELGQPVRAGLFAAFEHWDGRGRPRGLRGDAIPIGARLVALARDAEVLWRVAGPDSTLRTMRARRGRAYDPALADLFERHGRELLAEVADCEALETVLAAEPEPRPWVPESRLDHVLTVFADYVDLKSPTPAAWPSWPRQPAMAHPPRACAGPDWSTTWGGSACPTQCGTGPDRCMRPSGSGCASIPT